jgi:hypothetical protein
MREATHAAMSKAVLEALGWPGDRNLVARNAMFPDEVEAVTVEKYGAHVIGLGLSSLCHFTIPTSGGKFQGYGWELDKSVPAIDLSSVKVVPHPEAWGFPVAQHEDMLLDEPLAKLVRDLTGHGTIQADEITYSAGSSMVDWANGCYRKLAVRLVGQMRRQALDVTAGWQFHWAGDGPMPHHRLGILLKGHAAFEGDVDELYKTMEASGEIAALLRSLVAANNAPYPMTVRAVVEQAASMPVPGPCRLGVYRTLWRRGWNKLVRAAVLRALVSSVRMGKILMREAA